MDNVITNDYYDKWTKLTGHDWLYSFGIVGTVERNEFYSILRQDWEVSNFIQKNVSNQVYDIGSMKVKDYEPGDNIVPNADKIDDLRYRFFRFYA